MVSKIREEGFGRMGIISAKSEFTDIGPGDRLPLTAKERFVLPESTDSLPHLGMGVYL